MIGAEELRCNCRGCTLARVQGGEDVAKRIRDLHRQGALGNCVVCGASVHNPFVVAWPCDTIRAMDGEQG